MGEQGKPLILVTGATGFVGRHLCSELMRRGFSVRGTHRGQHPDLPGVEWSMVGEIGPDTDWLPALEGVRHVVHAAGLAHQVGVDDGLLSKEFQRINAEGTRRLLEAVQSKGLSGRFCYISSSHAVCTLSQDLITDQTPCRPDSAYGRSKLMAENLTKEILDKAGCSWVIVRPTLVYGPGNSGNMARLLKLVGLGLPLPLGDIQNKRSFVFIKNLVDALIRCLDHAAAEGEILAVNDGVAVSTPELVRMIGRVSGQKVRIFRLPMPFLRAMAHLGDLPKAVLGRSIGLDTYSLDRLAGSHAVDAQETFERLHWRPPYTMEEGLSLTLSTEIHRGRGLP